MCVCVCVCTLQFSRPLTTTSLSRREMPTYSVTDSRLDVGASESFSGIGTYVAERDSATGKTHSYRRCTDAADVSLALTIADDSHQKNTPTHGIIAAAAAAATHYNTFLYLWRDLLEHCRLRKREIVTSPPGGQRGIVMNVSVGLFACPLAYLENNIAADFSKFYAYCPCRSSVLL